MGLFLPPTEEIFSNSSELPYFWDVKDNASKISCKEKGKIFPNVNK